MSKSDDIFIARYTHRETTERERNMKRTLRREREHVCVSVSVREKETYR